MRKRDQIASVAWLNARLMLDIITTTRLTLEDDVVSAVLLAGISNANTSYLDARPELTQQYLTPGSVTDAMRRPANIASLAVSLAIPRETARGKLPGLVERGLVTRVEGGVIINTATLMSDAMTEASARFLHSTTEFIDGLAACGVFDLTSRHKMIEPARPVAWGALRLVSAHMLRGLAHTRDVSANLGLTSTYIWMAVAHETGGHLHLGEGSGRLLGPIQPWVGPVRGKANAVGLNMPEETVRRHLRGLAAEGRLRTTPDGYELLLAEDRKPLWREFQAQAMTNTRQLVWRLEQAGVIVAAD